MKTQFFILSTLPVLGMAPGQMCRNFCKQSGIFYDTVIYSFLVILSAKFGMVMFYIIYSLSLSLKTLLQIETGMGLE
jgi:hypothetical protein